ncbi:fibrobacter succinogenes major paralogous domain-containing protein [Sphingobacterium pedocola]|uniref:Fibrobacter succinogenes major paralogous domain-containing protein n=1 Tax=Sphingobacterium pedocola TaxID=2082722 RepID=A0ABR9T933_9SPHI|nr:fibrobacter succinogenes major paralogous domain-containing protein [Sphingobacterium pedocola]MBE8721850.1 hypothetical protein [Sphingobacterium pedocola]
MKTIKNIRIYRAIFPVLCALTMLFVLSCQKDYFARDTADDDVPLSQMEPPVVKTLATTNISQVAAQSGGEVLQHGGGKIRSAGIVWAENPAPTIGDFRNGNGFTKGEYRSALTKLTHSTTYYVRSYATNDKGTAYGEEFSFTTPTPLSPVVTLEAVKDAAVVRLGGRVTDHLDAVVERGICWTLTGVPTIEGDKLTSNASLDEAEYFVDVPLSSLDITKTYRIRAYTISNGGISYGETVFFNGTRQLVTDNDGNAYTEVRIGDQIWMGENFQSRKYRNGDLIAGLLDLTPEYLDAYGRLYSANAAIDARNLAPEGWRVPTLEDWQKLAAFVGQDGGQLKSTSLWNAPNTGATNSKGFTAVGGGFSAYGSGPIEIGAVGFWWTKTLSANDPSLQFRFALINNGTNIIEVPQGDRNFFQMSVRLIKE